MNYMKEVADILGVELGEEFKIVDKSGNFMPSEYKITKAGLMFKNDDYDWHVTNGSTLQRLLQGIRLIEWQPKDGDIYYYPSFEYPSCFGQRTYIGHVSDINIIKNVGGYKTPKQAQEKARELGWLE